MPGDCIVCVNGQGYRRFPPDYPDKDLERVGGKHEIVESEEQAAAKETTLTGLDQRQHYRTVLKVMKESSAGDVPLTLQLERHGWDSKAHSFERFLVANDGDVVNAMGMLERHMQWREQFFPVDLTSPSLQETIKLNAICDVCINNSDNAPTIFINYEKLLNATTLEESTKKHLMLVDFAAVKRWPTIDDVVTTIIMYTDLLMATAPDPTKPKICHFIDLSSLEVTMELNVQLIKAIYAAWEPHYPETLSKLVFYPVNATLAKHPVSGIYAPTQSFMLKSLIDHDLHSTTREKYVITDSLDVVCEELGWDREVVESAGGPSAFALQHNQSAKKFLILDNDSS